MGPSKLPWGTSLIISRSWGEYPYANWNVASDDILVISIVCYWTFFFFFCSLFLQSWFFLQLVTEAFYELGDPDFSFKLYLETGRSWVPVSHRGYYFFVVSQKPSVLLLMPRAVRVRGALKEGLGKAGCAAAKAFKPCLRQRNSLISLSPV